MWFAAVCGVALAYSSAALVCCGRGFVQWPWPMGVIVWGMQCGKGRWCVVAKALGYIVWGMQCGMQGTLYSSVWFCCGCQAMSANSGAASVAGVCVVAVEKATSPFAESGWATCAHGDRQRDPLLSTPVPSMPSCGMS